MFQVSSREINLVLFPDTYTEWTGQFQPDGAAGMTDLLYFAMDEAEAMCRQGQAIAVAQLVARVAPDAASLDSRTTVRIVPATGLITAC